MGFTMIRVRTRAPRLLETHVRLPPLATQFGLREDRDWITGIVRALSRLAPCLLGHQCSQACRGTLLHITMQHCGRWYMIFFSLNAAHAALWAAKVRYSYFCPAWAVSNIFPNFCLALLPVEAPHQEGAAMS